MDALTERELKIASEYRLVIRAVTGTFGDAVEFRAATLSPDGEGWDIEVIWRTPGKVRASLVDGKWTIKELSRPGPALGGTHGKEETEESHP